ncbi:LacI family DNA-binding transcriptional regulator [Luteibacter aegosomaticola]|uniref:LacI family DNA-binding transcriptional regulator n=1 Tax=Luteibacter aegosomaticola TaxID=2911538 RepID=UPI001FFA3E91|nr:LacI family DNA-binding transcriptional regulator [Luteibacter aegosomaticola]UPG90515.1 LacI family DNA-binding transcriptional regulator [Luteibacter aegosomaticola]
MPSRIGINDIAAAAGVSTATVDRVLNGRPGVSAATRKRVLDASRQLGARRHIASPADYRLRVLVIRTGLDDEFFMRIEAALDQVAAESQPPIQLERLVRVPTSKLRQAVREASERCHGVIVLAHDGGELRLAVERAIRRKIPVVAMMSDLGMANHSVYVGIDNVAAGRTAAWLISRYLHKPGRVLLLTGSHTYLLHRERSRGFVDGLAQWAPKATLVGPIDMDDIDTKAASAVRLALARGNRIAAIYNSGGANEGIRQVVASLPAAERPVWITHETHASLVELLQEGLITTLIDQRPETQAFVGLQTILHAQGELDAAPPPLIEFRLVTPANI